MTHVNNLMKSAIKPFIYIGQSIQEGRQRTANIEIARMLQSTEYRNESVDRIYRALCDHDLGALRGIPGK